MKLYKLFIFIIGISFASCEYDYDVDFMEFTSKVVVNSIINPDSTIKASLSWSVHTDETSYKVVDKFTAKLYENNSVIFDGDGIDGILTTTIYPKEGAKYRLEIDVLQYGKISTETSIPLIPTIDFNHIDSSYAQTPSAVYHHFTINKITANSVTRSLMIKAMPKGHDFPIDRFHTNNAFCDQFNAVINLENSGDKGSTVDYYNYIRIPYKNLENIIPLEYSIYNFFPSDTIITEIIAPSDEYDKYCKSVYQQHHQSNSIFSDTYPVHSNIENGLGIFAGYSSVSIVTIRKQDE